MPNYEASF
jgi:Ca2+-binding EF-hand superfamily protein